MGGLEQIGDVFWDVLKVILGLFITYLWNELNAAKKKLNELDKNSVTHEKHDKDVDLLHKIYREQDARLEKKFDRVDDRLATKVDK